MASVAHNVEPPTDSSFVGQILHRSSPVLTWRPSPVMRIPTPTESFVGVTEESTVQRVSRVPTRRVVAWPVVPVVPNVERKEVRSQAWSVAAHVTIALVLACGFALGVVALDSDATGVARSGPALRDETTHVLDVAQDTLAAEPLAPPPSVIPPAPVARAHKVFAAHAAQAHAHPATAHPGAPARRTMHPSRTAHR